jgi:PST family polysaccharide transporter
VYGNVIDPFNSLHEVAVGGFSKVLDNPPEFRRLWTKAISTLTFFLMPAFGLLAVTSQDLIVLLLGQKWAVAGVILSVFALRGIPQVLERTLGWLHVSAGRADRWMRWSLIATAAQLVSLFIGLPYGLTGVALALVLNTYALILPAVAYAGRPIGIGARHVIEAAGKPFVGAVVSVSLGFALRPALVDISSLQRTALLSIVFTLCYLGIVVGILRMTEPLLVGWSLVRHMLPGRLFPPAEATLTGGSERGL